MGPTTSSKKRSRRRRPLAGIVRGGYGHSGGIMMLHTPPSWRILAATVAPTTARHHGGALWGQSYSIRKRIVSPRHHHHHQHSMTTMSMIMMMALGRHIRPVSSSFTSTATRLSAPCSISNNDDTVTGRLGRKRQRIRPTTASGAFPFDAKTPRSHLANLDHHHHPFCRHGGENMAMMSTTAVTDDHNNSSNEISGASSATTTSRSGSSRRNRRRHRRRLRPKDGINDDDDDDDVDDDDNNSNNKNNNNNNAESTTEEKQTASEEVTLAYPPGRPWRVLWPRPHGDDPLDDDDDEDAKNKKKKHWTQRIPRLADWRRAWKRYMMTWEDGLRGIPSEDKKKQNTSSLLKDHDEASNGDIVSVDTDAMTDNASRNLKLIRQDARTLLEETQERTGIRTQDDLKALATEMMQLATRCIQEFMVGYRHGRDEEIDKMLNEYFPEQQKPQQQQDDDDGPPPPSPSPVANVDKDNVGGVHQVVGAAKRRRKRKPKRGIPRD